MRALLNIPTAARSVADLVADELRRVEQRFAEHLATNVEPVAALCLHVERYRGKMLRPSLVLLSGAAAAGGEPLPDRVTDELVTLGAVIEMIHVATLVHDDVLDEADVRRGAETVNKIGGNEQAVILGDYLIAKAYYLCSMLDAQVTSLRIGEITARVCEGETMQLANRGNFDLREEDYFAIIERKTAALIAVACEVGAAHAGTGPALARRFFDYGLALGTAFQIQDDLLDLVGAPDVVGKPLGKDLEKGKLTLPLIHHLAQRSPADRRESADLFRRFAAGQAQRQEIAAALERTGSIAYARRVAQQLIEDAQDLLSPLPVSPARDGLASIAQGVVARAF